MPAKKSVITGAKESLVGAAKTGAEGVKSVAGEALGAAAAAAAGVVMERIAGALAEGEKKLGVATPAVKENARLVAAAPFKPASKKTRSQTKMVGKNKASPKGQRNRKPSGRGR